VGDARCLRILLANNFHNPALLDANQDDVPLLVHDFDEALATSACGEG